MIFTLFFITSTLAFDYRAYYDSGTVCSIDDLVTAEIRANTNNCLPTRDCVDYRTTALGGLMAQQTWQCNVNGAQRLKTGYLLVELFEGVNCTGPRSYFYTSKDAACDAVTGRIMVCQREINTILIDTPPNCFGFNYQNPDYQFPTNACLPVNRPFTGKGGASMRFTCDAVWEYLPEAPTQSPAPSSTSSGSVFTVGALLLGTFLI